VRLILFFFQGRKFVGAIVDFANDVANDIRDIFENGEVADLLNSERVVAFRDDAKQIVSNLSDGQVTFGDVLAVGKLILDGIAVAVDFVIAGITDIVNAIGSFFNNVGTAILDWLGLGSPW
jgi:hypothetical protein